MDFKLYLIKEQKIDITEYVGNISWESSTDTLGSSISFDIAKDNVYISLNIECGDTISFEQNTKTIIEAIVINKDTGGLFTESITAFDFGFYLNKSILIKQFNKISSKEAIKSICGEYNIKVAEIPTLNTKINHIYYENTLSDIIEDILTMCQNETGKIYYKEIFKDGLYIWERGSKEITPTFKPAENIEAFNPLDEIALSFTKTLSIEDMKNKVVIISGSEKATRVVATSEDKNNIKKYGLLQHIENVDEKNINGANQIAKTKLKELNKINETLSIEILGDINIKAGRIITLNERLFAKGKYLIKTANHTLSGGVYKVSLDIERYS